jgi:phospholipid transport system transporter-binding protein
MYRVPAPITMATASAALALGAAALDAGEAAFSLDQLAGSDSSALAVLLSWQRRAVHHAVALRFIDIPAEMVNFARLYGIEDFLPGFPKSAAGAPPPSAVAPAAVAGQRA